MQKIRIDFDNPGLPQHISAVENDSQSRFFQATLYENGKAYTAPEGATYSIMYRGFGPQNQGWYDTINDGAGKRAACAVSGNVVTCEIARQALQVPGHVSIVLCVTTGKGYMLKSWPIECDCKNDRYDSTVEIQSFFYVTQISNESWTQAIQAVDELKNTIDPTLSVSGKAADAAKVGEAINAESERAKGVESQIKEDLGDLNKVSEKIASISIIEKCKITDGHYWYFIEGGKEIEATNENYIAVKIPVNRNDLIVYGEFQDWASRYVNNEIYTPIEDTYISHNTQTGKVAEFHNIPADAKYLCLSFYKGGLDTSIESVNVVSGKFKQNLSYRKTDFVDRLEVYTKDEVDDKLGGIHINKIYVATTGSDTEGNGTKEKPYATVLKANDVVTDASEKNKYEIIVADGTYTDLQEKYKGQNGSDYQGVIAKSYVTYKSESNNPEKCIFIWDGGVGYDTISNDTCTNKCFFHINSVTINTVIKGFKFVGSNLRYCLHFESNCLTTPYIENCIFDWHGRDFSPKNGPVIGMGGSIFSHITFKDCKFLNSQNDAGIQWHDNTYPYDWMNGRYEPEGLCPRGAVIECIDCLFDILNIQVRSQNEDRPMPCCLILKNCGGLKNVYPSIIAGGTKNYWKLFNQCSFIENDLLTDATETTTYDEMTSVKTSAN